MDNKTEYDFGLEPRWVEAFTSIFRKQSKIERVTIFGSRARGTQKAFSDVDFCLFGTDVSELDAQRLQQELEELYHPYQIDVVAFSNLFNQSLKDEIQREGKVFFESHTYEPA